MEIREIELNSIEAVAAASVQQAEITTKLATAERSMRALEQHREQQSSHATSKGEQRTARPPPPWGAARPRLDVRR